MGRKERRKSERKAVKNVGRDVYNMLISKTNQEYINKIWYCDRFSKWSIL